MISIILLVAVSIIALLVAGITMASLAVSRASNYMND